MLTRAAAVAPAPPKPLRPEIVSGFYYDHALTKSYIQDLVRMEYRAELEQAVAESEGAHSVFQYRAIGSGTIVLVANPELDVLNPPKSVVVLKPHDTKETTWFRSNLDLRTAFIALSNGDFTSSLTELIQPFHNPSARSPYRTICLFLNGVYPKQRFNHTAGSTAFAQQSFASNVDSAFDSFTGLSISPSPTPKASEASDMTMTTRRTARLSKAGGVPKPITITIKVPTAAASSTTDAAPVKRGPGRPKGTTRPKGSNRRSGQTAASTKAAAVSKVTGAASTSTIDDNSDMVLIKGPGRPRADGRPNASSRFVKRVSATSVVATPVAAPVTAAPVVPARERRERARRRQDSGVPTPTPAPAPAAPKQAARKKTKRFIALNVTTGNSPAAAANLDRLVNEFWALKAFHFPHAPDGSCKITTKAPTTYPADFVARALAVPTLINMQRSNFLTYELEKKKALGGLNDVDLICCLIMEWSGDQYMEFKRKFFDMWVEKGGWAVWDRADWTEFIIRRTGAHVRDPKAERVLDMYANLGWLDARHYV